ncbi:FAD-dependent oxidoreductase [Endozoicomonas sp. SCSIO W0465]|uniref:FAD-dependent oxidoreductase n=1 Tax=Endozoicomonas sp. SCSIO W0465 TaxID=2918516 RepID=UPI002075A041|nr:FAD-dependent oxidoreductase [Endozoicomonas sp. SCSIO W0465]USE36473.1 FAD-dependent oxidoreductase [Endozoicomonas sp. SCSIO W0465]
MNKKKWLLLAVLVAVIGAFYLLNGQQYLTRDFFQGLYRDDPVLTAAAFFVIYVAVTGLSLPGAALLTVVSGAIFGLFQGLLLASFASTLGATLAFLLSRTLLRDWATQKFAGYLDTINQGVKKDGAFYLVTLRLIPAVPFFVINLVMGLTAMRVRTFSWVSQLGMLPGTAVYVNAGAQLGLVEELSLKGILTLPLIASFILLGIFPWIARMLMEWLRRRRLYGRYQRPARFDNNLTVIGAGSAGLVSSYIAAAVKARVSLIEKHKMGGDCLNTGCVPSKALIRSAKMAHYLKRADEFGIDQVSGKVNFSVVMERVQEVVRKVEPHDSVERYSGLGVNCISGSAQLISPWEVEVDGKVITSRNIVIASGGRPYVPPLAGLDKIEYYTSDTIWDLRNKPGRMLVIGGGPIGCELTQAFTRLGIQVIQVDHGARLLHREDEDVSTVVMDQFIKDGVDLRLKHEVRSFQKLQDPDTGAERQFLEAGFNGQKVEIDFDVALFATGRKANTANLGLEALGIGLTERGTIEVNDYLQTRYPNIYACGDVAGPYQFTHTAAHQAWYCAVNALFGRFKKFKVDYSVIPWCTFTDPEVARVGLNEREAREQGIACEVTKYGIDDLDRAIADEEARGFVKVLTVPGKDKILGVTIVGYHAGELITEYVSAMKHGLGLNKILGTIHIYPTLSEANKYAAGEWKKAHAPRGLLSLVEKYHTWMRH